jgi:SAM-dependent methyltransferase
MHKNSVLLFTKYAKQYFKAGMKVLEVGPDGSPSTYQRLVDGGSLVWETLDMRDDPSLTYRASKEYEFPLQPESYDIVLSGQVIEHVREVWTWMRELARVCKKGGMVITINPVSWPYHEAPIDCWRIFPEGMRALYEYAGIRVEVSQGESLEATGYRRYIPGRSAEWQSPGERRAYRYLGKLGLPVECAYDTVTVGKKI